MADNSIAKHAQSPWSVGEQNGHCGISVNGREGDCVATVYLGMVTSKVRRGAEHFALPENQEAVANAHLIAAAPDLLAAMQTFVKYLADTDEEGLIEHVEPMIAARAAIAKAGGAQ